MSSQVSGESLNLLIDESQIMLDSAMTRTIIASVEVDSSAGLKLLEDNIKVIVDKHVLREKGKKVHFADFTQEEKMACVEDVSKIEFNAKVWVYYHIATNAKVAKIQSLRSAILALKKKYSKRDVTFLVEHATDYEGVVREPFMITSPYLSLLPDLCCYVMNLKLDGAKITQSVRDGVEKKQIHKNQSLVLKRMHEHIRLQVFCAQDQNIEKARSDRL